MKRLFTEPQRKAVPPEETIRRIREILSNRDLIVVETTAGAGRSAAFRPGIWRKRKGHESALCARQRVRRADGALVDRHADALLSL